MKQADLSTQRSDGVNLAQNLSESTKELTNRLIGDVAHELRTPIANIQSQLEGILEGAWEATPLRLRNCCEELRRITDLVRDLEQFHLITCDHLALNMEKVNLRTTAEMAAASFEAELMRKKMTCRIDGGELFLLGDRKRLHQVFVNLISNAIKYSPNGETIWILLRNEKGQALCCVEDHGIGIPEKEIPLIFERFYRTDSSRNRNTGGAGIGLSIVKAIVQGHQGDIKVESKEGMGTKIFIIFPQDGDRLPDVRITK